ASGSARPWTSSTSRWVARRTAPRTSTTSSARRARSSTSPRRATSNPSAMRPRRIAKRALLSLLCLVGLDQALDRFPLRAGLFFKHPVAPFDPPLFSPSQVAALARIDSELAKPEKGPGKFDAELGWCNPPDSGFGEFRYDWAGARIAAAPLPREK